jgi:hypothetical protein
MLLFPKTFSFLVYPTKEKIFEINYNKKYRNFLSYLKQNFKIKKSYTFFFHFNNTVCIQDVKKRGVTAMVCFRKKKSSKKSRRMFYISTINQVLFKLNNQIFLKNNETKFLNVLEIFRFTLFNKSIKERKFNRIFKGFFNYENSRGDRQTVMHFFKKKINKSKENLSNLPLNFNYRVNSFYFPIDQISYVFSKNNHIDKSISLNNFHTLSCIQKIFLPNHSYRCPVDSFTDKQIIIKIFSCLSSTSILIVKKKNDWIDGIKKIFFKNFVFTNCVDEYGQPIINVSVGKKAFRKKYFLWGEKVIF